MIVAIWFQIQPHIKLWTSLRTMDDSVESQTLLRSRFEDFRVSREVSVVLGVSDVRDVCEFHVVNDVNDLKSIDVRGGVNSDLGCPRCP
jgi:hypothetical protein